MQVEPKLFRKRPVVISAMQFNDDGSGYHLLNWANHIQAAQDKPFIRWHNHKMLVPTLEGEMTANHGDWIIRGVNDEFYPCKPDIFAKTYETAD